jgi:diguanylate cyclase (GGDEF)-like protein/PAS domain S-box-containing protein
MAGISTTIGTNFLAECDSVTEAGDVNASSAAEGIRAILRGDKDDFEARYPCHSLPEKSWYAMHVSRLAGVNTGDGAVVLSFNNASQLKPDQEGQPDAKAAAIAEKQLFITSIADHLPGMVGYWDKNLRCRFANHAYLEWFGKSPEAMLGISIQDLMGERLFALNEPHIRQALAGQKLNFERTLTKADGSTGYTLANYIPDINAQGAVDGFFVLVSDVTPMKQAEFELKLADSVYQNTLEGIFVTDAAGTILSVNPAFNVVTGFTAADAIGQTPRILRSSRHDPAFYAALWRDLTGNGQWQGEIWNRRKSGELFLARQIIKRIPGTDDKSVRYLSVFSDITELWHKNEKIKHLAFYDVLTELPNRSLLMDRLEHHIAMAKREQRGMSLMFLDLDGFKFVNDSFGHEMGDNVLKTVAAKLQAQVRASDTVARLGGDEFVILLDEPANLDEVTHIASRIVTAINEPMELGGKTVQTGVSIGIAMYPIDGQTPSELMNRADTAMYAAKDACKNTYRFVKHSANNSKDVA